MQSKTWNWHCKGFMLLLSSSGSLSLYNAKWSSSCGLPNAICQTLLHGLRDTVENILGMWFIQSHLTYRVRPPHIRCTLISMCSEPWSLKTNRSENFKSCNWIETLSTMAQHNVRSLLTWWICPYVYHAIRPLYPYQSNWVWPISLIMQFSNNYQPPLLVT